MISLALSVTVTFFLEEKDFRELAFDEKSSTGIVAHDFCCLRICDRLRKLDEGLRWVKKALKILP